MLHYIIKFHCQVNLIVFSNVKKIDELYEEPTVSALSILAAAFPLLLPFHFPCSNLLN